jgi:hypothetical protein
MKNTTIIQTSAGKLKVLALLLISIFAYSPGQAQVNINVNISSQSLWGPTGYDYVEYYYLPQVGVYYYVPTGQFIYLDGPNWVYRTYLPTGYRVDLYTTYKVVINEPKPYLRHNAYVVKYAKYKSGGPKQIVIRDSQDAKYYAVKGHPKHNQMKSNDNGNNKSSGNGNQTVKPSQGTGGNQQHQPAKSNGGGKPGNGKK